MTQDQALAIMKTGVNVYLTGSAGSGKTHTINKYIEYLESHKIDVAVTASTGIAATHIGGMTIHGWSGIGVREYISEQDLDTLETKQYLWKRFEKAKVLIIDEVSMLHAHRLDMVNEVCRHMKRNPSPFGGLQVILCGDFFQLPPVTRGERTDPEENTDLITHSKAWRDMNLTVCYLTDQYRQTDDTLTGILTSVRDNRIGKEHIELLRGRVAAAFPTDITPTRLYTHNIDVDAINLQSLGRLTGDERTFLMQTRGRDIIVEILKKSCLAYETLSLKIGTEVMFIKNNFDAGYVNGTRGIVVGFQDNDGAPIVQLISEDKKITVYPESWSIEEDGKVQASLMQLPLRYAWAITIHKSQGMSLEYAQIDLEKTFVYGMGYVALSRVRTLEGISLVGFNEKALLVDPEVIAIDEDLRVRSENAADILTVTSPESYEQKRRDFIIFSGGNLEPQVVVKKSAEPKIATTELTFQCLEQGMTIADIAESRNLTQGTIIEHIEKLIEQKRAVQIEHVRPEAWLVDFVAEYLEATAGRLTNLKNLLDRDDKKVTFDEIKLARIFAQLAQKNAE